MSKHWIDLGTSTNSVFNLDCRQTIHIHVWMHVMYAVKGEESCVLLLPPPKEKIGLYQSLCLLRQKVLCTSQLKMLPSSTFQVMPRSKNFQPPIYAFSGTFMKVHRAVLTTWFVHLNLLSIHAYAIISFHFTSMIILYSCTAMYGSASRSRWTSPPFSLIPHISRGSP